MMAGDDQTELAQSDKEPGKRSLPERDRELCHDKEIRDQALKLYAKIEKGFSDQWDRSNAQMDYWEIYNCVLGPKQFYTGNSKVYAPFVHDAVNARKTRFVNQIFPQSGKHVEVTASEDKPMATMSLLEFYIRKGKMRTNVLPALVRNGDVEGQYNLYMRWVKNERHVAMRVKRQRTVDDLLDIDGEDMDDIAEMAIVHAYPLAEVIADADVLVLPATADSVDGAIAAGGSASIIRRWSKDKIDQLVEEGEIDEDEGEALKDAMTARESQQVPDKGKEITDAAGIKSDYGKTTALIYETWARLEVEDEQRICRMYFGGPDRLLGCKLNPYWCDKVPLLSAAVERVQGSFKGQAKVKMVETLQYQANDIINQGFDSATYSVMPIIMTDPEKNPRVGSMVLNVAAIWETSPQATQFAQFPQLWKEAFQLAGSLKDQIFQTLGVNPAMLPQQVTAAGKKPNQAQIANEQMVDLLTTADAVTTLEGEILTPYLQWCIYLDHQFRTEDITVPAFGQLGVQMEMEKIQPIQMDRRFEFRWYGVEAARSMQQMQIQMAGINVLKQIPPQAIPGKELDLSPVVSVWVENIFGARLGGMIFQDIRKKLTLDPRFENTILVAGMPVAVHPMDNDVEHMQVHMQALQQGGDLSGFIRDHLMQHQAQMQKKQMAMAIQQQQMLQPPPPAGGGGGPRRGAVSAAPRGGQGPPGQIHQDRMPLAMPRPTNRGVG